MTFLVVVSELVNYILWKSGVYVPIDLIMAKTVLGAFKSNLY
jgi:hypothetical protein